MQSDGHEKADKESHRYLQCNIEPKKVASIIGLHVKSGKSRICRKEKKKQ